MYDILFTGANLYHKDMTLAMNLDIAVSDGRIVEIGNNLNVKNAKRVIDVQNKLVVPTFMDTHMHIDKAFTMNNDETKSLIAACDNSNWTDAYYFDWTEEQIYDEIYRNSSKVIENCVRHGTTLVKTNLLFSKSWRTIALDVMEDLKKRYKNYCDIKNVMNYPPEYKEELIRATKEGKADFVGGYPHLCPDHELETRNCFEIAKEFDLPLDLHCDESDCINLNNFNYIIEMTRKEKMEGKVTCGHVTGLSATNTPIEMQKESIRRAAEVDMNITTLTSCNMYLMNMGRRGPTCVRQLLDANINVAVASDNIRDTFRPFGNCDLLEEGLLTAQVHKMGTTELLRKVMNMVTYNAAKNALAQDYGLDVGCRASFNVLDAVTPEDAILDQSEKLFVVKDGRLIAEKGTINREFLV